MSRGWRIALGGLAVVSLAGAAAYGPTLREGANTGAGFMAKQMCSCMFVDELSFDACLLDMMPGVELFEAEILTDPPGVRARFPLLAGRMALFDTELGCTLQ